MDVGVRQSHRDTGVDKQSLLDSSTAATQAVFGALYMLVQKHFPRDTYLANLFKNTQRCELLARKLSGEEPHDFGPLFRGS
jgi:hypothetical protein